MKDIHLDILKEDEVLHFIKVKYPIAKSYEEIRISDPYYRFIRIIELIEKMRLPIEHRDSWLDLGCHHGQFLNLIHSIFCCNSIGMDDWDLKRAMPFTAFEYHAANLAGGEWTTHLRGKRMKYISALEIIEHMIDTDQFVRAIGDSLSDDGTLILSTPNINCLRNRVLVPLGVYPAYMEFRNTIHHVRLFNRETIAKLLDDNGFVMQRCIGVSFLPARFLRYSFLRWLSEVLADRFPALCGNLVVIATRKLKA